MTHKKFASCVVTVLCMTILSVMPKRTEAILVTNVTQDTVLFSHDYENGTVGNDVSTAPPTVGTWAWGTKNPRNSTLYADTTPYSGSQHLTLIDNMNDLAAQFAGPSNAGDHIRIQYAFRSGGVWQHGFLGGTGTSQTNDIISFYPVGIDLASDPGWGPDWGIGKFASGSIGSQTSFTHDANAWNTMQIDYVNGATTFDWSVNGAATETLNINGTGQNLTRMFFTDEGPWAGTSYLDSLVVVAEPLAGDLNGDGFVGQDDLNIVLGDWGNMPPGDPRADPSGDGFVGQDDLNPVLGDWGQGTMPAVGLLNAVPEPQSLWLAVIAVAGWLPFRRRKW